MLCHLTRSWVGKSPQNCLPLSFNLGNVGKITHDNLSFLYVQQTNVENNKSCSYAECRDRLLSDDGKCLKTVQKEQKRLKIKNLAFGGHTNQFQQNLDDRLQKKISRKLK